MKFTNTLYSMYIADTLINIYIYIYSHGLASISLINKNDHSHICSPNSSPYIATYSF